MDLLEERALLLFCFRICREIENICVSGDRLSRVPLEAHLFCLLTIVLLLFGKKWSDSYLRCKLFGGVALFHLCSKAGFTSKVDLRASGTKDQKEGWRGRSPIYQQSLREEWFYLHKLYPHK